MDDSLGTADRPVIATLRSPSSTTNVSRARNAAAFATTEPWLFFLDSDCSISPEDLLRVRKTLSAVDGPSQPLWGLNYARDSRGSLLARAYNRLQRSWVVSSVQRDDEAENLLGGALIVHRSLFARLGGFDEAIAWGGEETEFLRRAQRAGTRARLFRDAEARHERTMDLNAFVRRAWMQGWRRGERRLESRTISAKKIRWREFSAPELAVAGVFYAIMRMASTLARIRSLR